MKQIIDMITELNVMQRTKAYLVRIKYVLKLWPTLLIILECHICLCLPLGMNERITVTVIYLNQDIQDKTWHKYFGIFNEYQNKYHLKLESIEVANVLTVEN